MTSTPIRTTKMIGSALALLLLAISANAQTTLIPGILKRQTWAGATRAQIEAGSLAASNAIVTYPTSWDVVDGTQNYASRYSGVIIPDTTGDYDFFLAADDDTDLFISTNDLPAGKYMMAQETSWSGVRSWNSAGAGIASQKNSATWTNATSGGLAPYAAGIHLIAGTRYYLEGDHHGGGGGNNFAVTMVSHGFGVNNGDATVLTNTLIGIVIPTPTTLSFATHPSNTTAYVGMAGRFRVTTTTDSQVAPSYQWRRGGVDITNATGPGYTIIASSADNGAQFVCVTKVPGLGTPSLTVTSAIATLAVPASGALTVPGWLKRELFTGMTETAAGGVRTAIGSGNTGTPASTTAITSLDLPSAGANYGERVNGYFTPAVAGRYVFFIASDDDADLFVSTNDQPSGKKLVAQETVWSANRSWWSSGGGSSTAQKRSDQWVPDPSNPPATPPYAGGIAMTAGTRYYIEAVHRGGTGGNGLSATFGLTNDVIIGFPIDGTDTAFTNGVISYITSPVTDFTITNQPVDVTVFEGFNYSFRVGVRTDSEIAPAYQWRKNGTNVAGATASSYTALAAFADNNSHFSVDIVIAGVTNATSTTNTVTIQQGVVAVGQVRQEIWTNIPASGVTRALVEANIPGTVPTPDVTSFVSGFDVNGFGQNDYVQRLSGLFIPTVTTNYVFYLSSDDDGSLYLSTNDRPETKQRIAFEPNWSGYRSWTAAGNGSAADVAQKCSSTYTDPTSGVPGPGNPNGILLNAGSRYYVEIVMHQAGGGDPCGATYIFFGANPPANGDASALTGSKVGVLVPAATVQNFTSQPKNATVVQCQPVFFTAAATNDSIVPSTYQWRRNGTNIPGAVFGTTGFITSTNDNGATFDCLATAPAGGLVKTSPPAILTIAPGGTLVIGSVAQERWDTALGTRQGIESGSLGYANSNSVRPNIDYGFEGNNFGNRVRGYFIPPRTTNYVFFVASDDDSYLYLSPDDQPSRKVWIANESGWANAQGSWQDARGGGLNSQKRSDTFTPDGGVTFPGGGTNGLALIAGQKYYLEYVHHEGGGGDFAGVTYTIAGEPDPLNGDPSSMTNTVIGHLEAPPRRVLTAIRSGNSLNVSWIPAGGRLESTPAFQGTSTVWSNLGPANPATVPIVPGNLFLRVSEP
jgi:hypothetical protein